MEKNQEKNKILEIFFLKFGIPLKYLNQKSKLCVHPDGCLENILKGAGRSFKYGYLIRMMISVFGALFHIKNKKKPYVIIFILKKRLLMNIKGYDYLTINICYR